MRIAVLEHFTSLPCRAAASSLLAEGRAMRDAIVADLRRLDDIAVVVVERRRHFRRALRSADAALVIAPEENGVLERLCRLVERERRLLLGPSSSAVKSLSDKLATARCLAAAGVPMPLTRAVPFRSPGLLFEAFPPFVVKPRDGCGGRGVTVVRRRSEIGAALSEVRRATRRPDFLVQTYVEGDAASVSLIVSGGLIDLGLNRQKLVRGPRPAYLGGETFWPHPRSQEAIAAARAAVGALARAMAGVRGYLGVDVVLGRDGAAVIEVNPRLTTSYAGLRRSIRENLAALILEAAAGRALPERVTPVGRCRFGADGSITMLGERWETISAGTSAASI
jgi:predicted ATP-grasp superfamily ATP-dependent carboligase